MVDFDFVPETLEWCKKHYVPPIKKYISCAVFGQCDGMNGGCHWCREMFPYQWYMCYDESWVRSLLSPAAHIPKISKEDAAEFIEVYKQKHYT